MQEFFYCKKLGYHIFCQKKPQTSTNNGPDGYCMPYRWGPLGPFVAFSLKVQVDYHFRRKFWSCVQIIDKIQLIFCFQLLEPDRNQAKNLLIVLFLRNVNSVQQSQDFGSKLLKIFGMKDHVNIILPSGRPVYSSMRPLLKNLEYLEQTIG